MTGIRLQITQIFCTRYGVWLQRKEGAVKGYKANIYYVLEAVLGYKAKRYSVPEVVLDYK